MLDTIKRSLYVEKILTYVDTPFVKILTGVRRCGKSTILKMIIEHLEQKGISQILHYNFDSFQHENIKNAQALYAELVDKLDKDKITYLFFDEIQEVSDWERVINSLLVDFKVDIYVTGSNSHMMSSEISTYLTGRYISFKIFPLSFSEYLDFKKMHSTLESNAEELINFVKLGGFPAIHVREYTAEDAYPIIRDIYNSTMYSDIVKRNEIRKVDQLERIVKFCFNNVGRTFSALSISKYLKNEKRSMNIESVYNYLSALESAYILHRCSRFDIEGKEILKTQEKFYLADTALHHCVLGYSENILSGMLENIVYLELLRRGYEVFIGKLDTQEIDFVATRNGERIYIQVAQKITEDKTVQREFGNLLKINDNFPKYVLRLDPYAGGNYEGIKSIHLADFLLLDRF